MGIVTTRRRTWWFLAVSVVTLAAALGIVTLRRHPADDFICRDEGIITSLHRSTPTQAMALFVGSAGGHPGDWQQVSEFQFKPKRPGSGPLTLRYTRVSVSQSGG
jgi:hypothetical protein